MLIIVVWYFVFVKILIIDLCVFETLRNYDWPGNIRELQNTMERLSILAEGDTIRFEDIPFSIRAPKTRPESGASEMTFSLDEVEKHHILRVLAFHQGNKTKAAQALGVTIKTLYNKLHRYEAGASGELSPKELSQ
jgi:two-component system response regulator HydG